MRNTLVFLGVIITGVRTWFGYAFLAALMFDDFFRDCLWSNSVLAFFFTTGWILPLLVGYDLYKYLHRNETRRERSIDREIRQIKKNTFRSEETTRFDRSYHGFHKQINLN